jgi:hypothetical protein
MKTNVTRLTYLRNLKMESIRPSLLHRKTRSMLLCLRIIHISVDRRLVTRSSSKTNLKMKFSSCAVVAAVFASMANGFAGPQVTPRFALQVSVRFDSTVDQALQMYRCIRHFVSSIIHTYK